MSVDKAREFLGALQSDEAMAVRADDAYVAGLKGVAEGAGYAFSEDDLRQALDGAPGTMAEDELEAVAGGGSTFNTVTGGIYNTIDSSLGGKAGFTVTINPFGSFSKTGYTR